MDRKTILFIDYHAESKHFEARLDTAYREYRIPPDKLLETRTLALNCLTRLLDVPVSLIIFKTDSTVTFGKPVKHSDGQYSIAWFNPFKGIKE